MSSHFTIKYTPLYYLYSFTLAVIVMRMAIPFSKYLYIPLFLVLTGFYIIKKAYKPLHNYYSFLRLFIPYLILMAFYLTGIVLTNHIIIYTIKELVSGIIVFAMVFMWYDLIDDNIPDIQKHFYLLFQLIILFSILITLFGIGYLISGKGNSSIVSDDSFFSLAVFYGIICIFFFLFQAKTEKTILITNVILLLLWMVILFSSSRRALFLLFLLTVSLIIAACIRKSFYNKIKILLFAIFLLILTFTVFLVIPAKTRVHIIKSLNNNIVSFEQKSTVLVYRYYTILKPQGDYNKIFSYLYHQKWDFKDPDTG